MFPVVGAPAIIIPSGGVSQVDLHFMEQSASLMLGKCPLCHANVTHTVEPDGYVYFRCERQPVYHEWRRSPSFLTRD